MLGPEHPQRSNRSSDLLDSRMIGVSLNECCALSTLPIRRSNMSTVELGEVDAPSAERGRSP